MAIETGDVVMFHLVNGQTVVGTLISYDEQAQMYRVGRPMDFLVRKSPQGTAIGFLDFLSVGGLLPALQEYDMAEDLILLIREISKSVADQYRTEVSGLQIASAIPPQSVLCAKA